MSDFRWSNGSTSQFALRLIVWAGVALANPWVQLLLLIGAAACLVIALSALGCFVAVRVMEKSQ